MPFERSMGMVGLETGSGPLVVVVDDQEADRIVCCQALARAGYIVHAAESAAEGLEKARQFQPDIVVVDFSLPDMDGMSFIANLPMVCPDAAAIMLTGMGSEALAVRSLKAGVKDYIVKSVGMERELQASVRNTFRDLLTERELNQSRRQHDAMLRALPDAVLRVGSGGEVLERGAAPLPTSRAGDSLASPSNLHRLFGDARGEQLMVAVRQGLAGDDTVRCELELEGETGTTFHDCSVAPCGNGQSVIVIRDVTESKKIRRRLEEALEGAQAATLAKSAFLANMSHEIRTPMNGVLGMAEILLDTSLTEEQREHVGLILQSGRTLLEIIDDILDTSKVEAGKFELEVIAFPLGPLFRRACAVLKSKAEEQGNRIELSLARDLPEAILADPTRIQQVLLNYLSNANKFTEGGAIEVSVRLDEHEGVPQIYCQVKDTGLGIPSGKLGRLFLPFSQVDASTRRRYGGTGLGLSLSKQLVELMGGSVGVESQLGHGSTFWFRVPCQEALLSSVSSTASLRPGQCLRVLVAEDNLINQKVTARLLGALGHECVVVENGQQAVDELAEHSYDVVLMDCHMPEMDGYQATRYLRKSGGRAAQVRIVALTASAMPEDRALAEESGMDDFLSKPVSRAGLAAALDRCGTDPNVLQIIQAPGLKN